jgi:NADPH-dependent 2,4-dienoyl-CoA reductase/sulfur reductase-like enzyme
VGEVARDSPGLMRPRACGRGGLPRVLVVGAGVSGCACGATIAEGGFAVTIVNSALDTVGLLGFGPDLCGAGECVDRVLSALDELPSALKGVWLDSCVVPKGGPVCVAVAECRNEAPPGGD